MSMWSRCFTVCSKAIAQRTCFIKGAALSVLIWKDQVCLSRETHFDRSTTQNKNSRTKQLHVFISKVLNLWYTVNTSVSSIHILCLGGPWMKWNWTPRVSSCPAQRGIIALWRFIYMSFSKTKYPFQYGWVSQGTLQYDIIMILRCQYDMYGDSICIAIWYYDFTEIRRSKHIAHHMSSAAGQKKGKILEFWYRYSQLAQK
jgi:hypothetical protein